MECIFSSYFSFFGSYYKAYFLNKNNHFVKVVMNISTFNWKSNIKKQNKHLLPLKNSHRNVLVQFLPICCLGKTKHLYSLCDSWKNSLYHMEAYESPPPPPVRKTPLGPFTLETNSSVLCSSLRALHDLTEYSPSDPSSLKGSCVGIYW